MIKKMITLSFGKPLKFHFAWKSQKKKVFRSSENTNFLNEIRKILMKSLENLKKIIDYKYTFLVFHWEFYIYIFSLFLLKIITFFFYSLLDYEIYTLEIQRPKIGFYCLIKIPLKNKFLLLFYFISTNIFCYKPKKNSKK